MLQCESVFDSLFPAIAPAVIFRPTLQICCSLLLALACISSLGVAQDDEISADADLVARLQSPTYATRRLATWELKEKRADAIPIIVSALETSDADLTRSLVRLMGELASTPSRSPGPEAVAALQVLADEQVTFRGALAQRFLEVLADQQAQLAEENLQIVGVEFRSESIQILNSKARELIDFIVLGDSFQGSQQDLDSLRWLDQTKVVMLSGDSIDRSVVEAVARMPSLETLQIRNTKLTADDLEPLKKVRQLQILELLYTPVSDEDLELLSSLPIWQAIRLFGTEISMEGRERFVQLQPDIELVFGRGGYLGISSNPDGACKVHKLVRGGAAAKSGLQVNDVIVEINDVPIEQFEELQHQLSLSAPGEIVHLVVERRTISASSEDADGIIVVLIELDVKLGQQPSAD